MGITLIVVIVAAAVLIAVAVIAVVLAGRRRAQPEPDPPIRGPVGSPPMTGLETALDRATDRSGRPIREAIDAEASHVEDLRVPDDTGPLLRRALDHVRPDEATRASPAADADPPSDHDDPPATA